MSTNNQSKDSFDLSQLGFATRAIHVGKEPEKWSSRAIIPPIVLSTTFQHLAPRDCVYDYSRIDNPTRDVLEESLAALENGKYATCFSSGMGCVTGLSYLLHSGDHIILSNDVYGGVNRFYNNMGKNMGMIPEFVDMTNIENIKASLKPNTKMIWLESPSNPTLKMIDIKLIHDTVRSANSNAIIVVDNTFATPCFQNPLELGADIVMHALTKYINGHTDVIMGGVITNSEELNAKIKFIQHTTGAIPSPFDCYLVNRGLQTLPIRMKQHFENTLKIAEWLEKNPRIEKVLYPALPSHPQHHIYNKQMRGFGGMVSIYVKGDKNKTFTFLKSLKIVQLAVSLGGIESLISHPATMTHDCLTQEERDQLGISDNLLRISFGLEDTKDIIADLDQALIKAIPNID